MKFLTILAFVCISFQLVLGDSQQDNERELNDIYQEVSQLILNTSQDLARTAEFVTKAYVARKVDLYNLKEDLKRTEKEETGSKQVADNVLTKCRQESEGKVNELDTKYKNLLNEVQTSGVNQLNDMNVKVNNISVVVLSQTLKNKGIKVLCFKHILNYKDCIKTETQEVKSVLDSLEPQIKEAEETEQKIVPGLSSRYEEINQEFAKDRQAVVDTLKKCLEV